MEKYLIGVKMKINDLNTNSRVSSILHLSHKTWIFRKLQNNSVVEPRHSMEWSLVSTSNWTCPVFCGVLFFLNVFGPF